MCIPSCILTTIVYLIGLHFRLTQPLPNANIPPCRLNQSVWAAAKNLTQDSKGKGERSMNMLKTMMLAFAVLFSGMALASETAPDCPEGSEAPECQMKKDDSGSTN